MDDLSTILENMAELQQRLAQMDVRTFSPALVGLVEAYTDLEEVLVSARRLQFQDDAYEALIAMKAMNNKNLEYLSSFLRRFAYHVAKKTLEMKAEMDSEEIEEIIDRLTCLSNQDKAAHRESFDEDEVEVE